MESPQIPEAAAAPGLVALVKQGLRRFVLTGLRAALWLRSKPLRLAAGRSCLVIAPHPDDETLGCGGLIAHLRECHNAVEVVFLTDGDAALTGHPRVAPRALAALRTQEARTALGILGVEPERLHFLGAPDGRLSQLADTDRDRIRSALASLLDRCQPADVLLPWRRDGSTEHEAAFALVAATLRGQQPVPRLLEYPVWAGWSPRLLAGLLVTAPGLLRHQLLQSRDLKARALAAYRSQNQAVAPWAKPALPDGFADCLCGNFEYFVDANG
jgi:LmbE family N-acetylglucosaminyl deacetylase